MMSSIFHRISVRKFEDRPIEKEKIVQVLKAGMQAPSACNQQPWEFYVVTDKEKIQELSTATPYSKCAAGAPVVIVPVYRTEGLVAPSYAEIDLSIAQRMPFIPSEDEEKGVHVIRFTRNKQDGRYGLLNEVFNPEDQ